MTSGFPGQPAMLLGLQLQRGQWDTTVHTLPSALFFLSIWILLYAIKYQWVVWKFQGRQEGLAWEAGGHADCSRLVLYLLRCGTRNLRSDQLSLAVTLIITQVSSTLPLSHHPRRLLMGQQLVTGQRPGQAITTASLLGSSVGTQRLSATQSQRGSVCDTRGEMLLRLSVFI